ncbi:MAG: MarR family transcriptional regulator [Alphaproteobacteria bacterium]|nr:MarR family transcriptional regulator [Alphaproteobacteria bacterium]
MAKQYNDAQRREYLHMIDRVGLAWLKIFGDDTEFYSTNYWDLLNRLWRNAKPVRKTDALGFMTAVKSGHTAGKYLERAIERGFVVETENPDDARSRLVALSPEMRSRLDGFFDTAVDEIGQTHGNLADLAEKA